MRKFKVGDLVLVKRDYIDSDYKVFKAYGINEITEIKEILFKNVLHYFVKTNKESEWIEECYFEDAPSALAEALRNRKHKQKLEVVEYKGPPIDFKEMTVKNYNEQN